MIGYRVIWVSGSGERQKQALVQRSDVYINGDIDDYY